MILDSLVINRSFGRVGNTETYVGQIRFKGAYGNIEIALTDEISRKLLAVIGENAVDATRELAQKLSSEVFVAALPDQSTVSRELPDATVVGAT